MQESVPYSILLADNGWSCISTIQVESDVQVRPVSEPKETEYTVQTYINKGHISVFYKL